VTTPATTISSTRLTAISSIRALLQLNPRARPDVIATTSAAPTSGIASFHGQNIRSR